MINILCNMSVSSAVAPLCALKKTSHTLLDINLIWSDSKLNFTHHTRVCRRAIAIAEDATRRHSGTKEALCATRYTLRARTHHHFAPGKSMFLTHDNTLTICRFAVRPSVCHNQKQHHPVSKFDGKEERAKTDDNIYVVYDCRIVSSDIRSSLCMHIKTKPTSWNVIMIMTPFNPFLGYSTYRGDGMFIVLVHTWFWVFWKMTRREGWCGRWLKQRRRRTPVVKMIINLRHIWFLGLKV